MSELKTNRNGNQGQHEEDHFCYQLSLSTDPILFNKKIFTIPHSTLAVSNSTQTNVYNRKEKSQQHIWSSQISTINANANASRFRATLHTAASSIIAPAAQRSLKLATTIEGGSISGDTSYGDSNLRPAITANPNDIEQFNENLINRAGGGGGGGGLSVSASQTPPTTPTSTVIVGKTLLNTNANLLPITTASDTFNNLKNLVKIEKSSPINERGGERGNNYHRQAKSNGYNRNSNNPAAAAAGGAGAGASSQAAGSTGTGTGATASLHFSTTTGYQKNSAKIRQYDSEVSPRPRRTYQGDSSSSRYYTKNSDNLGQAGQTSSSNSGGGYGLANSNNDSNNVRRNGGGGAGGYQHQHYQQQQQQQHSTPSDGGYNRNLNAHTGGSGNYRQSSSRYDNNNVNGNNERQQQRQQYGNNSSNNGQTNNGAYSNFNTKSSSSSSYNRENHHQQRDNNVNSRAGNSYNQQTRDHEYGGNRTDYRDFDDAASAPPRNRYNNSSSNCNTNSLERRPYHQASSQHQQQHQANHISESLSSAGGVGGGSGGGGIGLGSAAGAYERNNYTEKRAQQQRSSPPLRGGSGIGVGSGNATTNLAHSNSSSRGVSPNSSSPSAARQQHQQLQQQQQQAPPVSTTPPPPSSGRWVPPSLRPQHGLTQSEKNDAVFRRVRGILNKLTPEKFQELSDELLKLDLNSIVILRGVILLIFDKALDEPKYSSMYAQLCKRLSEEAPSFDKDSSNSTAAAAATPSAAAAANSGSCTFLRLLIAVCRDKFNNRQRRDEIEESLWNAKASNAQAAAAAAAAAASSSANSSGNNSDVDSDEEERKHLAKQRMLGNVKFIGELNKLDMLSKNVLHQCIMELLEKKKKRTATPQEMCEDMECLAQLLKTCGKNLDSEQGKELMNQYFEKLERRSKSMDYPPRIRFMLKDVIELRENNWVPRKVGTAEGPVPIKQIRTDDDNIIRTPFAQQQRNRDLMRNNERDGDSWMTRFHLNLQPGFNDSFSGLSLTGASPLVSPFANANNNTRAYNNNRDRNSHQNYNNNNNNNNNNRYNKHNNQNGNNNNSGGHGGGGHGGNSNNHRNEHHRDDVRGGRGGDNGSGGGGNNNNQHMNRDNSNSSAQMNAANKELAPRFKRNLITATQDSVENLQMRPAANSLLFKAASQNQKLPAMLPISTPPTMLNEKHAQYPLLGTPNSIHLANPTRPSSTPSAEYEQKSNAVAGAAATALITGDKGLKATSSTPNFANTGSQDGVNGVGVNVGNSGLDGKDACNSAKGANQLVTKHGSIEKPTVMVAGGQTVGNAAAAAAAANKQKKDKAFNKEEVLKKSTAFMKEHFFYKEEEKLDDDDEATKVVEAVENDENNEDKNKAENSSEVAKIADFNAKDQQFRDFIAAFTELKVPEKCLKDVCIQLIMDILDKADEKYFERVINFLEVLRKEFNMKPNIVLEVFKQVINRMNEREALNPRINTHVAILLAKAVASDAGLLKLNDIANYTDNGQHYPLFLLVLQQLHKSIGKEALFDKFNACKIDLLNSLPEADRNKARLAEILDERNLAFLYPLLKVQAEMLKQLTNEPNPSSFYKWIKANVESKFYKDAGFVSALMTVVLKFITNETSLAAGTDIKKHPDKAIIEKEEALLIKYCQILQTFFGQELELQLLAIYALQVFCFNENFPKGMLCRWFKYLYEASVIEEETFIKWKEEISDKYPGKGSALFQVNSWLTWLQEAESEDEDE